MGQILPLLLLLLAIISIWENSFKLQGSFSLNLQIIALQCSHCTLAPGNLPKSTCNSSTVKQYKISVLTLLVGKDKGPAIPYFSSIWNNSSRNYDNRGIRCSSCSGQQFLTFSGKQVAIPKNPDATQMDPIMTLCLRQASPLSSASLLLESGESGAGCGLMVPGQ